jgi:two-component system copper resistance phosphate regulon response regulator CusR
MRVLVVEDEERMAALIAAALRDDGHGVEVAGDGVTALALALADPFELIVLDVMLPAMDGITLCRRMREQRHNAPVLMLTARGTVVDRVAGLDAGADDYLVKPFAVAELLARVRALARRPFGLRGPYLRTGDLVLDSMRYEAVRAGHRLDLTLREFNLLAFLVRHAGEAVSRATILDEVWGEDAEPYGNVVDQYVHYLRSKTEQHGPRMIETVRGVGYIMNAPNGEESTRCSEPSASD